MSAKQKLQHELMYLKSELERLIEENNNTHNQLVELKTYLESEKFIKDPTVQVIDILNRLPQTFIEKYEM